MHDLVKDSHRYRLVHNRPGIRYNLLSHFDSASGWFAAAITGALTACVAFLVDIAVVTVSDWKLGYCKTGALKSREECCAGKSPLFAIGSLHSEIDDHCANFHLWSTTYATSYAIYVAFALAFGICAGSVTLLTKRSLPAASPGLGDKIQDKKLPPEVGAVGKSK